MSGPDRPSLTTGSRVDHYVILERLERGGRGSVYLARDERLDRSVVLTLFLAEDPSVVELWLLRAKMLARLNHPNNS